MHRHRHAFTLIELLVVLAIISTLAAMLLPAINLVRNSAQQVTCGARLRALTLATMSYTNDFEGYLPEGGYFNSAANGQWALVPQVTAMMQYMDVKASNTVQLTRALRCPGNPTGIMYPFMAAQAADHPQTIARFDACAKRWGSTIPALVIGGGGALWSDAAFVSDGGNGLNFNTACGHRGVRTGPTSGTPRGGNVSFTDGSVKWAVFQGNTTTSDLAFVFNGGSIGGGRAVPSNMVFVRLDGSGNLETSRTDNLILGRSNRPYLDAAGNSNF